MLFPAEGTYKVYLYQPLVYKAEELRGWIYHTTPDIDTFYDAGNGLLILISDPDCYHQVMVAASQAVVEWGAEELGTTDLLTLKLEGWQRPSLHWLLTSTMRFLEAPLQERLDVVAL